MILFLKDWNRFLAIPDYQTSNKSFLEFSALLKSMGVKNYLFPLTLFNHQLQGIDPHSPVLSEETQAMIRIECILNPWYYLREVVRVPPVSGDNPVKLIANRANISLWWCFLNHLDYFLVQIRQTGKSLNIDILSVWYQVFGTENSRANLFTKDGDLIKENIARLKKIRKLLPPYLVNIVKADTDNQKEFTNLGQGNRLVAVQAQSNEDAARNVGRGITAPFTQSDEVAFLKFGHISIPIMLAGTGAAREEAARNGLPYGNIFSTTAGKLDSEEGSFAYNMLMDGAEWSEIFYDCEDRADLLRMVRAKSRDKNSLLINGTFSHRQLGYTDEWLRQRISDSKQKGDDVRRDFMNEWTTGSLTNPLSTDILRKIKAGQCEPDYNQVYSHQGYMVKWYYPEEVVKGKFLDRQLVMGADTSNAVGRDSISGAIIDVSTLEVMGTFEVNETNIQVFSAWFAKFLAEYPTITVVPESKSTWIAILDYLLINLPLLGVDPGRRIYSLVVDNANHTDRDRANYADYIRPNSSINRYTSYRRHFGFPTNGSLRELLYGPVIQEAAKVTGHVMRDSGLINQIAALTTKNGRVNHASGKHDDLVIAWLLAHWFLSYAKNIDHYGIDPGRVKRGMFEQASNLTWQEARARHRQYQLREDIEKVIDEMGQTRDEYQLMRLEHRLNSLFRKVDDDQLLEELGSIDALLREAQDRRSVRQRRKSTQEAPEASLRRAREALRGRSSYNDRDAWEA